MQLDRSHPNPGGRGRVIAAIAQCLLGCRVRMQLRRRSGRSTSTSLSPRGELGAALAPVEAELVLALYRQFGRRVAQKIHRIARRCSQISAGSEVPNAACVFASRFAVRWWRHRKAMRPRFPTRPRYLAVAMLPRTQPRRHPLPVTSHPLRERRGHRWHRHGAEKALPLLIYRRCGIGPTDHRQSRS